MNNPAEIPLRRFKALLVVDLEATCWAASRGPREDMETIKFGAVLVRMSDLRPIDERSWFIRPRLHSNYCTNLTSITQDRIRRDSNVRLDHGLRRSSTLQPSLCSSWQHRCLREH
jgi:inhibitor of KinA sporulation pathway (predicted exonuclease)